MPAYHSLPTVAERIPRFGLIAPASDPIIESDFWLLARLHGANVYTTRIPMASSLTQESLAALSQGISDCVRHLMPDNTLDAIIFGCTSGSILIGEAVVEEKVCAVRDGCQVINPAASAVAALRHLGVGRLAIIAPYERSICELVSRYFVDQGLEVVNSIALELETDEAISALAPEAFVELVKDLSLEGVDAIFISCTASRALLAIEEIERMTGLPVVTSNQASFWYAMRSINETTHLDGFGALLK